MSIAKWADLIWAFFANPIILSCMTSWFFSQLVKGIIVLLQIRKKSFKEVLATLFWRTGGMPSSHVAVVTSMTAAVAFREGIDSNLFAVSLVVAMVVLRDAIGVRRASGLQALALNLLGRNTAEKLGFEFQPVMEVKGHAPLEVIVGGLFGILIAATYAWL